MQIITFSYGYQHVVIFYNIRTVELNTSIKISMITYIIMLGLRKLWNHAIMLIISK